MLLRLLEFFKYLNNNYKDNGTVNHPKVLDL